MRMVKYKQTVKFISYCLFLLNAFYSCTNTIPTSTIDTSNSVEEKEATELATPKKHFTHEQIAGFAIATIMNQPEERVAVSKSNEIYIVSYTRSSDSQKFKYKIRFDENKILWGNSDGRWRDSEYDEQIRFEEADNKIKIIQRFSDGSEAIEEYGNR